MYGGAVQRGDAMGIVERFARYEDANSFVSRIRARRAVHLQRLIDSILSEKGSVRILDVGGTEKFWNCIDLTQFAGAVHIVLANVDALDAVRQPAIFSQAQQDGRQLEYEDDAFDLVHSNSVIEHVGSWPDMYAFARETQRVGQYYFVQTPNYWFPVEPHCLFPFFQYLPRPARLFLVRCFRLGHWSKASSVDEGMRIVESASLLTKTMLGSLFPAATVLVEKFCLLNKSFMVTNHPAFGPQ